MAKVLQYDGQPTPIVEELFKCGGDVSKITDEGDIELFREHGLLK